MWIRILGSAAGGGYPQWNCTCPSCRAVRTGSRPCEPRSQSCVAVSGDREHWYLVNASPDVRTQIEAFDDLHPQDGRVVRICAVLLTDAELDHTLGLLLLREGRGVQVHGTPSMHETLTTGTGILRTLAAYCPVDWRAVQPGEQVELEGGLTYRAFEAPTDKRARFCGNETGARVVGYRISDAAGGDLVCLPSVQQLAPVLDELQDCSCLLMDGTCWQDDEMSSLGLADKTSRSMGHVPMSGPDGSLERLRDLPIGRKIYLHLNNTNPVLLADSPERAVLDRYGFEVARDGLELEI